MNLSRKTYMLLIAICCALSMLPVANQVTAQQVVAQSMIQGDAGVLYRDSYDTGSLKSGNVLQEHPYVTVCGIEQEDGKIQVMEYVGKGTSNGTPINYWKVRHVDAASGTPMGFDKYIRAFPQSDCGRPHDASGVDFGNERPQDTVWAIGDPSKPTLKPEWNPLRHAGNYSKFADVGDGNDYVVHIRALKESGIIDGDDKGNFNPSSPVTRAAFTKLMVEAFHIPLQGDISFSDTKQHWAEKWVSAGVKTGIVNGTSATTFDPDVPVKREEAAVIVWRYLNDQSIPDTASSITLYSTQGDSYGGSNSDAKVVQPKSSSATALLPDQTDEWALSAVKNIIAYGLYGTEVGENDKGGYNYHSLRPMTREEAAVLIHTALNLIK